MSTVLGTNVLDAISQGCLGVLIVAVIVDGAQWLMDLDMRAALDHLDAMVKERYG